MKLKNIPIILALTAILLTGCTNQTEVNTEVLPSFTPKDEEFILGLVNCNDAYISRYYGGYEGHKGIDVASPEGREIYAADDGTVSRAVSMNMGYGTHCIIDHDGYRTLYAHCSQLTVSKGDTVKKGDVIGYVGNTGNSTGPHLHFEVINTADGTKIDPLDKF